MNYTEMYNEVMQNEPGLYDAGDGVLVPVPQGQSLADVVANPNLSPEIRDMIIANEGPPGDIPVDPRNPYALLLQKDPNAWKKDAQIEPETFMEGAFGLQRGGQIDAGTDALQRVPMLKLLSEFYGGARDAAARKMNPNYWKKPEMQI